MKMGRCDGCSPYGEKLPSPELSLFVSTELSPELVELRYDWASSAAEDTGVFRLEGASGPVGLGLIAAAGRTGGSVGMIRRIGGLALSTLGVTMDSLAANCFFPMLPWRRTARVSDASASLLSDSPFLS